ncbi:MAG: family ATPase [Nocardioidaceae bacterium]|nr:family ATPase [Nocardioidaceae bacterium]
MRLHRLELTAFGPFPGTEVLDLDALGAAGLFLLTGSTGAGKTSLLDGICFALFGRVPGDRQEAKRLRSDHAGPEARPSVQLEVTVSGRRLRLTRSPEWRRAKRRGVGTVTQHATVVLEELGASGWSTLSTRIDETQHLVESLLGMDVTQFTQVVMLPQGRFEAFLRAGAGQRQALLEKLFGTARFRNVEQWLVERRQQTGRAHDGYVRRARSLLAAMHGVVGLPPQLADASPEGWTSTDGTAWTDVADALCRQASADVADARADVDRTASALDEAERHHARARARAEATARATQARTLLAGLHAGAAQAAAARDRLELAERAREVTPLLAPLQRSEQELATARVVADEARARAGVLVAGLRDLLPSPHPSVKPGAPGDPASDTSVELADCQRLLERHLDRLEGVAATAEQAQQHTVALTALDDERGQLVDEHATLTAQIAPLPERLDVLGVEVARAEQARGGLDRAAADVVAALAIRDAAVALDQAETSLDEAERARRTAVDAHQQAREQLQEIQRLRLAGAAASLASALRPGSPCAVCGAVEHPAPAVSGAPVPHEDDERHAQRLADERETARAAAEQATRDAEIVVAELRARTGGCGVDVAETQLQLIQTTVAGLTLDAGRLDALRAEAAAASATLSAGQTRLGVLERTLAGVDAQRAEHAAEQRRLRDRVQAVLGPEVDLPTHQHRTTAALEQVHAALQAVRRHEQAQVLHSDAVRAAESAAREHGFVGVDCVRSVAMETSERAELAARLEARDRAELGARQTLADPEVVNLTTAGADDADLTEAADELERCTQAHTASVGALAAAVRADERLSELRSALVSLLTEGEPVRERFETVQQLAALAEGKSRENQWQMSLAAYVLTARLEQVVDAANERLDPMTGGRYTLEHTAARTARDRRGGLGLLVRDGWTGTTRDPRTLSGGETFQASLALALGLADVVGHESGGAEMHTLFVDEGFGALDTDCLDEVMDVLDGLRAGGRVVGLVSHVPLLRERVPVQVRVQKGRTGSVVSGS